MIAPQREGHAPGWKWHRRDAGRVARPWAWSQINGGDDLPAHVSGLCEWGWHLDCPQAANPAPGESGTCSCGCHIREPLDLLEVAHLKSPE